MSIPVVDVFAGPGGLGEGFSAFRTGQNHAAYRIAVSAETDAHAAKTLRLRAFFRQFPDGKAPASYYQYVTGKRATPWTDATFSEWERAGDEAQRLTLGVPGDDALLDRLIAERTRGSKPWVLVGGPPCQAYSLMGRARNQGTRGYVAASDERHFLYQHYLRILERYRPAAFIMENVKGILSSRVGGEHMFPRILGDLQRPGGAKGVRYNVIPVLAPSAPTLADPQPTDFILRAETLGVPQARHRVVLLGLAEGIPLPPAFQLSESSYPEVTVVDAIGDLPRLRSQLTTSEIRYWNNTAARIFNGAATAARPTDREVSSQLHELARNARHAPDPGTGGRYISRKEAEMWIQDHRLAPHLRRWQRDDRLPGHLNHEARGHMEADLQRYGFSAVFAQVHGRSPRGPGDFPQALSPAHKNWQEGKKFVDRFNVQRPDCPSSTVTSHLAKDGHYFIHPDPAQLRSLTVREAARLQTFPDNYFFEGPAGSQRKQVGNAVPPWLAHQIASVVHAALGGAS